MEAFYNKQSITQISNTVIRANQPLAGERYPQAHPVPCQVGRCHYDEQIYDGEMVKKKKQNGYVLQRESEEAKIVNRRLMWVACAAAEDHI